MMQGTLKTLMAVVALLTFSSAAMGVDMATNHWQLDGDLLDAVGSNDGSAFGAGNFSSSTEVSGSVIFDPQTGSVRPNTGSVKFNGGGSWSDRGINVGALEVMDSYWKPFTVELLFKAPPGQKEESPLFGRLKGDPQDKSQRHVLGFTEDPDDLFVVMQVFDIPAPSNTFFKTDTEPVTDSEWHHAAFTYEHSGDRWDLGGGETNTLKQSLWLDYQFVTSQTIVMEAPLQRDPNNHAVHLPSPDPGLIGGAKFHPNPGLVGVNVDEVRILNYAVPEGANGLDHFLQPDVPEPATLSLIGFGLLAVLRRHRR
jgi:hypothetical protein